jgi:hypothetical protein
MQGYANELQTREQTLGTDPNAVVERNPLRRTRERLQERAQNFHPEDVFIAGTNPVELRQPRREEYALAEHERRQMSVERTTSKTPKTTGQRSGPFIISDEDTSSDDETPAQGNKSGKNTAPIQQQPQGRSKAEIDAQQAREKAEEAAKRKELEAKAKANTDALEARKAAIRRGKKGRLPKKKRRGRGLRERDWRNRRGLRGREKMKRGGSRKRERTRQKGLKRRGKMKLRGLRRSGKLKRQGWRKKYAKLKRRG